MNVTLYCGFSTYIFLSFKVKTGTYYLVYKNMDMEWNKGLEPKTCNFRTFHEHPKRLINFKNKYALPMGL